MVADELFDLGRLYCSLRDYSKAAETLERARAVYEKTFGLNHRSVLACLKLLVLLHLSLWSFRGVERSLHISRRVALQNRAVEFMGGCE